MDSGIENRLLQMLDKQDILECLVRYCRAMDRLDKELLLSCYHPDATDDHGSFVGSPNDFWNYYSAWHGKYNRANHHSISNTSIEIKGNTAHSETYWLFESMNVDGSNGLSGGRYIDRFEKRNDVWKIAARACLIEWSGALGDIVVPEVFAKAYAETGTSSRDRSDLSYMRPLKIARPSKADPF
jgi:ketosteroid isomerase-like protein